MQIPTFITNNASMLYDLFYALPFYLVTIAMLWVGWSRKYPMIPYALILAMGRIGFLLGTWVGGSSIGHFGGAATGRSTMYSLVFALVFVWGTIKWLDFKKPVLDVYALFLPMALALQRLGCLSVGCCHGSPTDALWGVQYPLQSVVGLLHLHTGLVPSEAAFSLSVHPIPVYLIIGYLLVQIIVFKVRHSIHFSGGLAMLSLALLSVVRFVTEFFRDPHTNQQLGSLWMGLKGVQWVSIIMFVAFMGLFYLLYKLSKSKQRKNTNSQDSWIEIRYQDYVVGLIIVFSSIITYPLLNRPEWISQLPLLLLLAYLFLKQVDLKGLTKIIAICLIGTGAAVAAIEDKKQDQSDDYNREGVHLELGVGVKNGSVHYPTKVESGCGGDSYSDYKTSDFSSGDMSLKLAKETDIFYSSIEFQALIGQYNYPNKSIESLLGTQVFGTFLTPYAGVGFGYNSSTTPGLSVIDFEHVSYFVQLGNFKSIYLIGGYSDNIVGQFYGGIGGRGFSQSLDWQLGVMGDGFYTKLQFLASNDFLLELNANQSLLNNDLEASNEIEFLVKWNFNKTK